ncbi:NAD(P)-binding protein [Armillaria solidipes]|uniref:NAD(P)-binding protein n=1 Tax=Armillaria solidipes TaxID=1076256 RepID=A0A2H3BXB5_9AGAR|nr:NAD(P)-binding protein [Armillaria solidipes]
MSIASIRASNASIFSSLTAPTAVFFGGTAGIGQAMAQSLASHTQGNANIIIVGRNAKAAQEIIDSFPRSSSSVKPIREFVSCDASLMSNVASATEEVKKHLGEKKVDFLVLTTGYLTTAGREETKEGMDKKMAVAYYAKWKFVKDLLSSLKDEGSRVVSVMAPGYGGSIDVDDLDMKKSYSAVKVGLRIPTYLDLMSEGFAQRYPYHSFIHAHPGAVRTNYVYASPSAIFRYTAPLIMGLAYPFTISPKDCAEYMWHGTLQKAAGAFRVSNRGEDMGKKRYFGDEEQRQKLWDHTAAMVEAAPRSE